MIKINTGSKSNEIANQTSYLDSAKNYLSFYKNKISECKLPLAIATLSIAITSLSFLALDNPNRLIETVAAELKKPTDYCVTSMCLNPLPHNSVISNVSATSLIEYLKPDLYRASLERAAETSPALIAKAGLPEGSQVAVNTLKQMFKKELEDKQFLRAYKLLSFNIYSQEQQVRLFNEALKSRSFEGDHVVKQLIKKKEMYIKIVPNSLMDSQIYTVSDLAHLCHLGYPKDIIFKAINDRYAIFRGVLNDKDLARELMYEAFNEVDLNELTIDYVNSEAS